MSIINYCKLSQNLSVDLGSELLGVSKICLSAESPYAFSNQEYHKYLADVLDKVEYWLDKTKAQVQSTERSILRPRCDLSHLGFLANCYQKGLAEIEQLEIVQSLIELYFLSAE